MSLQQRWFHMLMAHQGIADASPVQRHNWGRRLMSAGVLGLTLVLLFDRLSDGSLHDGMRRSMHRSPRSCPFRMTGEPSPGMAISFSTPPCILANTFYL